jgi:hypothetical protein
MKPRAMVGLLLLLFGGFVVFRGLTYQSQSNEVRIGDVRISAEERRAIPTWVGVAAIVGGVVLLAAGGRRS